MKLIPSPPKSRRRSFKSSALSLALAAGWLMCTGPALKAADYTNAANWSGTVLWNASGNWDSVGVPGTGDTVTINKALSGSTNLTLENDVTVASFNRAAASTFRIVSGSGSKTFTAGVLTASANLTFWNTTTSGRVINVSLGDLTASSSASVAFGQAASNNRVGAVTVSGPPPSRITPQSTLPVRLLPI